MQFCCAYPLESSDEKYLSECLDKHYVNCDFFLFFKAGLVKIKDFSAEELIGIMDELIACLVGV